MPWYLHLHYYSVILMINRRYNKVVKNTSLYFWKNNVVIKTSERHCIVDKKTLRITKINMIFCWFLSFFKHILSYSFTETCRREKSFWPDATHFFFSKTILLLSNGHIWGSATIQNIHIKMRLLLWKKHLLYSFKKKKSSMN